MLKKLLSGMTMYTLMKSYLASLVAWAILASWLGYLPFNSLNILLITLYLCLICVLVNKFLGSILKIPTNPDSPYISATILALIFGPLDLRTNFVFLFALGVIAMSSKFLLAHRQKHIFNPAALAAVIGGAFLGTGASWWVGHPAMLVPVILGGITMASKIRRFDLIVTFTSMYLLASSLLGIAQGQDAVAVFTLIQTSLQYSPLLFFAFVMLVEPITAPPTRKLRLIYAALVALVLVAAQNLFSSVSYSLELSLLLGNIFAFITSPRGRYTLTLEKIEPYNQQIRQFWFRPLTKIDYKPGQYMEWSLPHPDPDTRGIRRWFTISSSPSEDMILLTTRLAEKSSSFKQALQRLKPGQELTAVNVDGDFTLPSDSTSRIIFIAGGIGITPFRSMIKYMLDTDTKRDITLFYGAKTPQDFVFKEILDLAAKQGVNTIYVPTEAGQTWSGHKGYIDAKLIKQEVPDFKQAITYISGPEPMVRSFSKMLIKAGVPKQQIKHDDFPGYTETYSPLS